MFCHEATKNKILQAKREKKIWVKTIAPFKLNGQSLNKNKAAMTKILLG
jgi:hypothetical protein